MSTATLDNTYVLDVASSILDAFGKAFIALDEGLTIVYASPSISAFIGKGSADIVGKPAASLGPELDDSPDSFIEALKRQEIVHSRRLELSVEGQLTPVMVSAAPVDAPNLPRSIRYLLLLAGTTAVAPGAAVMSEAEQIRLALQRAHWRREIAARALGMSRSTLWRKMRELHIE